MNQRLVVSIIGIVFISILVIGCGKSASEKAAEKIIEEQTGSDVDIEGEKVTIKTEEGDKIVYGSTSWPESELGKRLPSLKGEIVSLVESAEYIGIALENISQTDIDAYINKLKEEFPTDFTQSTAEKERSCYGSDDQGYYVSLTYSDGSVYLTVSKDSE